NNPVYLMDKVIVPIFNSDLMVGIVELKDAHHLPKNQIEIIKNLVELPSFSSEASQKLNSLIKLEHNLMSNEIKNANNVIPFHPSSPSFLNPLPEKKFSLFSTKKLTDYSTLILANSYSNIEAMSQEIHYRSERYALLPFDDIDIRQSTPPELLELGSISLFVPEIKDLSEDQRNTLERVLRLPQDQEGPR
ncbi:MAG: hypothetical protein KDD50_11615, partial [Bdellovibrionales bacterium]|nr:hypothetical protein [Bdellovibrionales bacterium]